MSISKIRFLESEGLVSPERAPSGYRKYADADVARLRYILDVQKNHYLPLKVIKEHLDLMDRGLEPPSVETPKPEAPPPAVPAPVVPKPSGRAKRPLRLSRRELLSMSGLGEAHLAELERAGLVVPRRGTVYYGRDALTVAVVARKLQPYGMDSRHLRAIRQSAEREVGLIEQAVTTHVRRGQPTRPVSAEIMQWVLHAHAALMRQSMSQQGP